MHKAYSELRRDPNSFIVFGLALGVVFGFVFDEVIWGGFIGTSLGVIFTKQEKQRIENEKDQGVEQ